MKHSHSNEIVLLPSTPATGLLASNTPFPGQPLRPLKKRRILSVDRNNEYRTIDGDQHHTVLQKLTKKEKNTREVEGKMTGVVEIARSPPSSPIRIKKSVTWNDREGNLIHSKQGPTATTKRFFSSLNESDLWYTVSLVLSAVQCNAKCSSPRTTTRKKLITIDPIIGRNGLHVDTVYFESIVNSWRKRLAWKSQQPSHSIFCFFLCYRTNIEHRKPCFP